MNKRQDYRFLQYFLYKFDVQNGGAWASTVNSKNMNLISTQKVYLRVVQSLDGKQDSHVLQWLLGVAPNNDDYW